jgi:hypothetical protein
MHPMLRTSDPSTSEYICSCMLPTSDTIINPYFNAIHMPRKSPHEIVRCSENVVPISRSENEVLLPHTIVSFTFKIAEYVNKCIASVQQKKYCYRHFLKAEAFSSTQNI